MKPACRLAALASLAAVVLLFACKDGGSEADPRETSVQGPEPFTFVVLSDIHVRLPGNPDDRAYDAAQNLANLDAAVATIGRDYPDADLVMVTGDLVGCLFSENPADYGGGAATPADVFKQMMDRLPVSYYPILGNHDYEVGFDASSGEGLTSPNAAAVEAVWRKVLGIAPYYAFVHKGIRFVCLNSNRGPSRLTPCVFQARECGCIGSFDDAQLDWLETQLAGAEPCLLFVHHPLVTDHDSDRTWSAAGRSFQVQSDRFYSLVDTHRTRVAGIFVGHGHLWESDTLHGLIPVFETGPVGDIYGSGANIRIVRVTPSTSHGRLQLKLRTNAPPREP